MLKISLNSLINVTFEEEVKVLHSTGNPLEAGEKLPISFGQMLPVSWRQLLLFSLYLFYTLGQSKVEEGCQKVSDDGGSLCCTNLRRDRQMG